MSSVTARALRTSLRRTVTCNRYSSSSSSSTLSKLDVKPQSALPAEKMRILVDLYHDTETFITKENLSSRIDQAFIHSRTDIRAMISAQELPLAALVTSVQQHNAAPEFSQMFEVTPKSQKDKTGATWSQLRSQRATQVVAALYGASPLGDGRPGYDAVMDQYESAKKELEEEAEAEKQQSS